MDKVTKLSELKSLLDSGAISEEEFNKMKQELLASSDEPDKTNLHDTQLAVRQGIGWQEVVAVLFGIIGGVIYGLRAKQKLSKKLIVLLLALFSQGISNAFLSGGDNSQTVSNPTETQVPAEQSSQPDADVIPLGTPVNVREDRILTVNQSSVHDQISTQNEFIEPVLAQGGKLLAVYLTIKNSGNESGDMTFSTFKLEDSQGRSYDAISDFQDNVTINTWAEEQGLSNNSSSQVFPGGEIQIVKVFRISADASSLVLVVNNQQKFAVE